MRSGEQGGIWGSVVWGVWLCFFLLMSQFSGPDWERFLDSFQNSYTSQVKTEVGLDVFFLKLKRLMETKSNLGWHIRFFDRYLRERVNPQGLRVQIFPTFEVTEIALREKWETNLNQCSANMMIILRDKHLTYLVELDKEIENLRISGNHLVSNAEYKKKELELIQHLEKYNKNVILRKDQKFYKDQLAFAGGYAYKWQQNFNNNGNKTFRRSNYQESTTCKSDSDASISSSSFSSQKFASKTPRGPAGRGRALKRGNGGGQNAQGGDT